MVNTSAAIIAETSAAVSAAPTQAPGLGSDIHEVTVFRVHGHHCETRVQAELHKLVTALNTECAALFNVVGRSGADISWRSFPGEASLRFQSFTADQQENFVSGLKRAAHTLAELHQLLDSKQCAKAGELLERDLWNGGEKLARQLTKLCDSKSKRYETEIKSALDQIVPAHEEFDYFYALRSNLGDLTNSLQVLARLDQSGRVWNDPKDAAAQRGRTESDLAPEARRDNFAFAVKEARLALPSDAADMILNDHPTYQWDPKSVTLYVDQIARALACSDRYFDLSEAFLREPRSFELDRILRTERNSLHWESRELEQCKAILELVTRLQSIDFNGAEYNHSGAAASARSQIPGEISTRLFGEIGFVRTLLPDHGWTPEEREARFPGREVDVLCTDQEAFIRGLSFAVKASEHYGHFVDSKTDRVRWYDLYQRLAYDAAHVPSAETAAEAKALWPLVYRRMCFNGWSSRSGDGPMVSTEYRTPQAAREGAEL